VPQPSNGELCDFEPLQPEGRAPGASQSRVAFGADCQLAHSTIPILDADCFAFFVFAVLLCFALRFP
jgi:hypothetical protein